MQGRSIIIIASLLVACGSSASRSVDTGPSWVARLDADQGQLPEGLTLDAEGETAYIGLAPTGQVLAVELASGATRAFASVPAPPPNQGYLFGLAFNAAGELFAAVASATRSYQPGIYRVPPEGGPATLFASHPALQFPNGLTFDQAGKLYVSDSLAGAIFAVDATGVAVEWLSDAQLRGDMQAPCANGAPFPIGANGLALFDHSLFVVNSDHGSLLRVPIEADGSAGAIVPVVGPNCALLGGADGLTVDDAGTLFVAANQIEAITAVTRQGQARVIATSFDFPASLVLRPGTRELLVTNASFKRAQTPGAVATPGLVMLNLSSPPAHAASHP